MNTPTTISKHTLLNIIKENRAKHREVFEASLHGYAEQARKRLRQELRSLSQGRTPEIRIVLSRPQDHTRDYDRIIRMLELDIGETFTLTESMFAQYVMDDWDWKRQFLKMSYANAPASTTEVYGVMEEDDYL